MRRARWPDSWEGEGPGQARGDLLATGLMFGVMLQVGEGTAGQVRGVGLAF